MADTYLGSGQWQFDNAAFSEDMTGGTLAVAGSPSAELNNTFTIDSVESGILVTMSPAPSGGPTLVRATSIVLTYDPPSQSTAGPEIVGVSLIPIAKDGMDKLGSNRRAT